MSAIKYWLWLSAAAVSPKAKAVLIDKYSDAEKAFYAPAGEFETLTGVSKKEAETLEKRDISCADRILAACARQGIRAVTMQDADYPQRLKNIFAPPVVIYLKGRLHSLDDEAAIAVIGTRKASAYGLKMGRKLAYEIVRGGGVVVSLLTSGVDAAAARGALLAGGRCVGVLGTPHECEAGTLAAEVAARGALISEYPPGTKPEKHFFRDRNRIAAGLSVGVTVVEAPERSGARLFAETAMEQGREIFAVPGNADAPNSVGTIAMIKDGAKPVVCGWDVLSEFESRFGGKLHELPECELPEEEEAQNADVPAKKSVDKPKDSDYIDLKKQLEGLNEDQLKIIAVIGKSASHIDDIIASTGLSTARVLSQLTVLEIKGYVRRDPGRRVALNIAKK